MTDDETPVVETKPRRVHRRTKPVRGVQSAPKTTTAPTPTLSNGTPDRLAEMEQWDEKIAARRRPDDEVAPRHPLAYNYPLRWYRRPDGDIVQLQGDPNNLAMYEDLGFVVLSPRETREWLENIQPRVVEQQRRCALLITAMRRFAQREGIVLEYDEMNRDPSALLFSDLSLQELEEFFAELAEQYPGKLRMPRTKADRQPSTRAQSDPNLRGIETGGVDPRIAGLIDGSRQAGPGNGRTIEVTPRNARQFV